MRIGASGRALLSAYRELECFPEVPSLAKTLKAQGKRLAILSNGSPAMLESAVEAAGLQGTFDAVLSVDALRRYKTHPDIYEQAATHFRVYPGSISFQSSNRWDIAGAVAFGFRAVWINRYGAPDEYADLAAGRGPPVARRPVQSSDHRSVRSIHFATSGGS